MAQCETTLLSGLGDLTWQALVVPTVARKTVTCQLTYSLLQSGLNPELLRLTMSLTAIKFICIRQNVNVNNLECSASAPTLLRAAAN